MFARTDEDAQAIVRRFALPDIASLPARRGIAGGIIAALWSQLRVCSQDTPALAVKRPDGAPDQSRHGLLSRITAPVKKLLRNWVRGQPDRTLAELVEQLHAQGIAVSRSRVSQILHQMGLRLKNSRSTPLSETRKPTASPGRDCWPPSPPSRRRSLSSSMRAA